MPNPGNVTHGHNKRRKRSKTYISWVAMKTRCTNPWQKDWKYYGGKGITFDPRWSFFENFLMDMGERPEGYTLERLDNSKNYCKENCIWIPACEQSKNRKFTKKG